VTDADGAVVRDCWVILFAQDSARWTPLTRYLAAARPGLDDRFHVQMPPGEYYAVAIAEVEPGAWTDPEFLSQLCDRATRLSIADGESKSLDLALKPAPAF
jgi:hypothetical protein